MFMEKLNTLYNLQTIQLEIDFIVNSYGWSDDTQIALQSRDGKNWHEGLGKSSVKGFNEKDFNVLNTKPNWELTKFITENKLYRTRILKLIPKTCYTYHQDWSKRVHLAVITHPFCFMVENDQLVHIPADGHPYLLDTTQPHLALNGSKDCERIHIVGCTEE